jgi:hypothetical protein
VVEQNSDAIIEKVKEKAFDGAILNVADLKREDGIATVSRQQGLSFVNHLVFTAPKRIEELNEIILSLNFENPDEPDLFADAFSFALAHNAERAANDIFRTALARSAGIKMGRAKMGVEAITHSNYSFQGLSQNTQNKNYSKSPIGKD